MNVKKIQHFSAKQDHVIVLCSDLSLLSWVSYSLYQSRENVRQ